MNPEFRRLALRLGRFLSPLLFLSIAYGIVETIVLPIDYFAFRSWEALVVYRAKRLLPGPFYPNRVLERVETGDLGHGTPRAVRKYVAWRTDRFGFRDDPGIAPPYDIVVVGDSFTVGTSLTQADTLPVRLAQATGRSVYGYAPEGMDPFLADARFLSKPYRVVVMAMFERLVPRLQSPAPSRPSALKRVARLYPGLYPLWEAADRMLKTPGLNHLRAKSGKPGLPPGVLEAGPYLFQKDDLEPTELSEADVRKVTKALVQYRDEVEKGGHTFIFMPIPKKESVYWKLRPDGHEPRVMRQVVEACRKAGIRTVDLPGAFARAVSKRGAELYQRDDTHWNAEGVGIAADLIAHELHVDKNHPQP